MTDLNPYSAPVSTEPPTAPATIDLDPIDREKIETIINDAEEFWIANIFLVFICGFGALIAPICYVRRILQWQSLAGKYPALLADRVPAISIQAKFQAAHWKLIAGIVLGLALFTLVVSIVFWLPTLMGRAGPFLR